MTAGTRYVVITGGTQGLGRAMALAFGSAGYTPICVYRSNRAVANELSRIFADRGIAGQCIEWNVEQGLPALPDMRAGDSLTLINNACPPFTPTPLHLLQWDAVQAGIDVMVKGSLVCMQTVLRPMTALGGGLVINVLSTVIDGAPPKGFAGYAAAKYALLGLGRSLVSEYGHRGIRAFAVSPGTMDTALTRAWSGLVEPDAHNSDTYIAQVANEVVRLAHATTLPHQGENYIL